MGDKVAHLEKRIKPLIEPWLLHFLCWFVNNGAEMATCYDINVIGACHVSEYGTHPMAILQPVCPDN